MHPAITPAIWHAANQPLEARVDHMYLDVKGYVTTGVGNLIDSVAAAVRLPWRIRSTGALATPYQISSEWDIIKAQPPGRRAAFYAAKCDLYLTAEAIDALVWGQVLANDAVLAGRFKDWPAWPADAQFAAHLMAWAAGAGWSAKFPKCTALLKAGQFAEAGGINAARESGVRADPKVPSGMRVSGLAECDLKTQGNPGVIPRNALIRLHYIAAGSSLAQQYPDVLHGPLTLDAIKAGWVPA